MMKSSQNSISNGSCKGEKIIQFDSKKFKFTSLINTYIRNIYPNCFDPGEINNIFHLNF